MTLASHLSVLASMVAALTLILLGMRRHARMLAEKSADAARFAGPISRVLISWSPTTVLLNAIATSVLLMGASHLLAGVTYGEAIAFAIALLLSPLNIQAIRLMRQRGD